jgi:hypothetical protein
MVFVVSNIIDGETHERSPQKRAFSQTQQKPQAAKAASG